ncbi:MAG: hypothetical protein ABSH53_12195 [Holophaga sp.]
MFKQAIARHPGRGRRAPGRPALLHRRAGPHQPGRGPGAGAILERHGYTWTPVEVGAGLHLKSSVTWAGEDRLILAEAFRHRAEFAGFHAIPVDPGEACAANSLWINGHLLVSAGHPRLRARLEALGLLVHELDTSEISKMDGGLTCLSLRF